MSYYSDLKLPFGQTASGRMVRPVCQHPITKGAICARCKGSRWERVGQTWCCADCISEEMAA